MCYPVSIFWKNLCKIDVKFSNDSQNSPLKVFGPGYFFFGRFFYYGFNYFNGNMIILIHYLILVEACSFERLVRSFQGVNLQVSTFIHSILTYSTLEFCRIYIDIPCLLPDIGDLGLLYFSLLVFLQDCQFCLLLKKYVFVLLTFSILHFKFH